MVSLIPSAHWDLTVLDWNLIYWTEIVSQKLTDHDAILLSYNLSRTSRLQTYKIRLKISKWFQECYTNSENTQTPFSCSRLVVWGLGQPWVDSGLKVQWLAVSGSRTGCGMALGSYNDLYVRYKSYPSHYVPQNYRKRSKSFSATFLFNSRHAYCSLSFHVQLRESSQHKNWTFQPTL